MSLAPQPGSAANDVAGPQSTRHRRESRSARDHSTMSIQRPPDDAQRDVHASPASGLRRWILARRPPKPINPALLKHAQQREKDVQNRIADLITAFAGSMTFVYIHIIWFGCWIVFGVERYPFGLLTMIVSLEAIFLSTFVMISQNRADARRQILADHQWRTVQDEDEQNKELLDLSRQILALTKEVRGYAGANRDDHDRSQELLDLSRRTLALTIEVHAAASVDAESGPDAAADKPVGGASPSHHPGLTEQ
jgi:uncharacterized membrane protein